ncbi:Prolyl 3-hydroxylase OGFOD1 [Symbiodinium microadriaticum]|uniref:Prolyl 3-hydroxylase OGFOD1 n=1 Tax=Symbiodinium microadriaticum TaxID=2951 RepID=A0A1Q9DV58_SYMMI|nr:Prolyl 3-hydroxylase OGFOD1 [Symbiodinium microadriaticum]CAE7816433.1 ogfod1 [Symbiodinium microadriaticum]
MGRGPRKRAKAAAAAATQAAATKETGPEADAEPSEPAPKKRRRQAEAGEESGDEMLTVDRAASRLSRWAEDEAKQQRWLESRGGGLEGRLEENGASILRLRDFLPLDMAECVLTLLKSLPEEAWELSQRSEKEAAQHRFASADVMDIPQLAPLRSVFWKLLPSLHGEPTLPIFSAGRYGEADYIGRHDDKAHVPFFDGNTIYSRTVAAIWYLTKDWDESDGGQLEDLEEGPDDPNRRLVPIFNSLVVFKVPHWHAVTAVTAKRPRYSIFGWWHQKGKRYDLDASTEGGKAKKPKVIKRRKKKPMQGAVSAA